MGKLAKILAPAIMILTICVAVASYLLYNQGKMFRERSRTLAENLAKTATTLDPVGDEASKVSYTKAGLNNKESGTLGWPKYLEDPAAYATAAGITPALAEKVVANRDYLADKLAEAGAAIAAGDKSPKADQLKDFVAYEGKVDGFLAYLKARNTRDNNVRTSINKLLSTIGTNPKYAADITADGKLSPNDVKAFDTATKGVQGLRNEIRAYQTTIHKVAVELDKIKVKGVKWQTPTNKNAFSPSRLAGALQSLEKDLATLKTQLPKIDQLNNALAREHATNEMLRGEITRLKQQIADHERVLVSYYEQGAGEIIGAAKTGEAISSIEEIDFEEKEKDKEKDKDENKYKVKISEVLGKILVVDSKFGFIITSLNHSEVCVGLRLAVTRGSSHIGLVEVIEVNEFNSTTKVVQGNISNMDANDTVFIAPKSLQPTASK